MKIIDNFNLIVSTGKDFENQAKAELWFNLLSIGDDSPIIFNSEISGLVLASTSAEPRELIRFLNETINTKDIYYSQYIHKVFPLDMVVPTDLEEIKKGVVKLVETHPYCQPSSQYRITIRKRRTDLKTQDIITAIASNVDFKVNLQQYDWIIQIEIIGANTGIGILKDNDIFRPIHIRKELKK